MRSIIILIWLMLPSLGLAQVNPEEIESPGTARILDELSSTEINACDKRIDLNKASAEELASLPGIDHLIAIRIISHRVKFGPLLSKYELMAIPGIDRGLFAQFSDCVTIPSAGPLDFPEDPAHISAPGWKALWEKSQFQICQGATRTLQQQRGYLQAEDGSRAYAGSPWKTFSRLRVRSGKYFSFGLQGEKDPGEETRPIKEGYYDFVSGHLFLRDWGKLKRFVIGDYTVQSSQGLSISAGLGLGKGPETILGVKQDHIGIRPHTSTSESGFLRGIGAAWSFGFMELCGFHSSRLLDAKIYNSETGERYLLSVNESGLHRTVTENQNRSSLKENLDGIILHTRVRSLTLTFTHVRQRYSIPFQTDNSARNYFAFRGLHNEVSSISLNGLWRNVNYFSESSISSSKGLSSLAGILVAPDPKVDFAVHVRSYSPSFHSSYGQAFSESGLVKNEKGLYLGIRIRPFRKTLLSGYFDQYSSGWYSYSVNGPGQGSEVLAKLTHTPNRTSECYLLYKSEWNGLAPIKNPADINDNDGTIISKIRLNYKTGITPTISCQFRIEYCRTQFDTSYNGFMLMQDLTWKLSTRLQFSARICFVQTEDYSSRIYAYERDLPGAFSVPAYDGELVRQFVVIRYKLHKFLDCTIKYGRSRYFDRESISSGYDEIEGTLRSEFKILLSYVL